MPNIPAQFRDSNYQPVEYDGSPVEWRVSVYGICIQDDSVLLVHHNKENFYDAPGGGVELDETLEEALLREGKEEAGWELRPEKFIYAVSDWFYHSDEKKFYRTLQHYYKVTGHKLEQPPTDKRIVFAELVPLAKLSAFKIYPHVENGLRHLGVI